MRSKDYNDRFPRGSSGMVVHLDGKRYTLSSAERDLLGEKLSLYVPQAQGIEGLFVAKDKAVAAVIAARA